MSPLFKKGEKTLASNYRPVSLTSIPCKIMEGIIRAKIEDHLYSNNLLAIQQHGFVKSKSCTTNLLETLDFILYYLDKCILVDVIMLDFAKAFDTVPHRRLLAKLKVNGINGLAYKWIEAFLKNRKQRIVVAKLFLVGQTFLALNAQFLDRYCLLYTNINDLPKRITSLTKLYADDTKILLAINSEECVVIKYSLI